MIIHHDQVGFIPNLQGWFNIRKINGKTPHQQEKRQKHMIISKRCRKSISQFNIHSKDKNWVKENIFQHNKAIYDKPTANIIPNSEKLKAFPTKT